MVRKVGRVVGAIDVIDLGSERFDGLTLDGRWGLAKGHPGYTVYLLAKEARAKPSFEYLLFIANCLSFDHEVPTLPRIERRAQLPRALFMPRRMQPNAGAYCESVAGILEGASQLRLGGSVIVPFQTPIMTTAGDLPYSSCYGPAAKEMGLYAGALRQVDVLSEYLQYYRVIECIAGGRHREWIAGHFEKLRTFQFAPVVFRNPMPFQRRSRRDLVSLYRIRAVSRLSELRKRSIDIVEHLYNTTRCGIAHGKHGLLQVDYAQNLREVSRDTPIIKLLARMAILRKLL